MCVFKKDFFLFCEIIRRIWSFSGVYLAGVSSAQVQHMKKEAELTG